MKPIVILILFSSFSNYQLKAQHSRLSIDNAQIINQITFDHNSHYHPGYNLSHRIKGKRLGHIKKEIIDYSSGSMTIIEFLHDGQYKYIKRYKNDTLKSEFLYEYDGNKLIKERGQYEVDYKYINDEIIGLNPNLNNTKFYRAKDTILIKKKSNKYKIIKNTEDPVYFNEKFEFEYMPNGDLKKIDIYLNNVRTGIILNKFDSLGRAIEHNHIHAFSSFFEESKWQRNFRNSVYFFEYNDNNLIEKYAIESYNGTNRRWEGKEVKMMYKINPSKESNEITVVQNQEGNIKFNKIKFDETGNWIKQTIESDKGIKVIKKTIEYY